MYLGNNENPFALIKISWRPLSVAVLLWWIVKCCSYTILVSRFSIYELGRIIIYPNQVQVQMKLITVGRRTSPLCKMKGNYCSNLTIGSLDRFWLTTKLWQKINLCSASPFIISFEINVPIFNLVDIKIIIDTIPS